MVARFFYALIGIVFMLFILRKVKNKQLVEKESFFWMIGAIGIVILGLFPSILDFVAKLVHITYPPSLLFLLGTLFSLGLIFRLTIYISLLKEQIKDLGQNNCILEKRIECLEEWVKNKE